MSILSVVPLVFLPKIPGNSMRNRSPCTINARECRVKVPCWGSVICFEAVAIWSQWCRFSRSWITCKEQGKATCSSMYGNDLRFVRDEMSMVTILCIVHLISVRDTLHDDPEFLFDFLYTRLVGHMLHEFPAVPAVRLVLGSDAHIPAGAAEW